MIRSAWLRLLVVPLLAATLLLPIGCVNPFEPADPEPPSGAGVPENFETPEDLLLTVELALSDKSPNGADAFLHAMAESTAVGDRAFRAFYDPGVKSLWLSVPTRIAPEPWDITLERGLHSYLTTVRLQAEYTFQFTADNVSQIDVIAPDTALVHRKYTLYASVSGGEDEVIAVGFCDLSLEFENNRWFIFRWNDRVDPSIGVNPADTDQRTFSWRRLESL